jgi:hypothetical protein
MTSHSLISSLTQCKYSLLHLSHGTLVLKSLLALHLRLVPQNLSLLSSPYEAKLKSHHIKHPLKNHFFNIMTLAWISSRYECWDQSTFCLTNTETYMDQHQYGQANSRFLISFSFWLDTPNTHFNIYLHTSSLIKSMQSDFPNLCPYKQTNIETD